VYRDLKPANCLLSEDGHVKITDLGLACEISKSKPSGRVGTTGYIAPEVIMKDVEYDCCSDWFSFGCMLYKMLSGHSPFSNSDYRIADKLTLTKAVDMPSSWSDEAVSLVASLLEKDPKLRLGCNGAESVKKHCFFATTNWDDVFAKKYTPPFIPPRGEVNAADADCIGVFETQGVKTIKLTDKDQDKYKEFDMVVSAHWQDEICVTNVFDAVNEECAKVEAKKLAKMRRATPDDSLIYDVRNSMREETDCIVQGYMQKLTTQFSVNTWAKRYYRLYPNRLEWSDDQHMPTGNLITLETVQSVEEVHVKRLKCLKLVIKEGFDHILRPHSKVEYEVWLKQLHGAVTKVERLMRLVPKAFQCSYFSATSPRMTPRFPRVLCTQPSGTKV
jgi:beta-adrenergic-receptor kinase